MEAVVEVVVAVVAVGFVAVASTLSKGALS